MRETLDVFYRNGLAGHLYSDQGRLSFSYDPEYLNQTKAAALSTSLPLQAELFPHEVTYSFFSGLLPDEKVRQWLARFLHVSEENVFGLLKEIGGDCAGAVSLYPPDRVRDVREDTYRLLNEAQASDMLLNLDKHPFMAGEEGIRISGAGAQSKMMIAFHEGRMAIPMNNTPSTHIIKPAIDEFEDTVHNEFFCMRLAALVGLPAPDVKIYFIQDKPYYLVARYDRTAVDGAILRLHQEDFCQAMGFPPHLKYQNEGGPTLEQCFTLLESRIAQGLMAGRNKLTLLQGVMFNFLIGNGDAHGKNFSLLYDGDAEALAPFYDLMCTLVYSDFYNEKMAMKIGSKYKFRDMSLRQFDKLAEMIGYNQSYLRKQLLTLTVRTVKAAKKLAAELDADPETASPIYQKIVDVIAQNASIVEN